MRRRRRNSGGDDAEVDMTPMLDIVFIMLIFFIVTATFLDEQGIDLTQPPPPPDSDAPSNPKPAITVYVDQRNACAVDSVSTECDRVGVKVEGLLADKPDANIILRIHAKARHELLVGMKDGFDEKGMDTKVEVVGR